MLSLSHANGFRVPKERHCNLWCFACQIGLDRVELPRNITTYIYVFAYRSRGYVRQGTSGTCIYPAEPNDSKLQPHGVVGCWRDTASDRPVQYCEVGWQSVEYRRHKPENQARDLWYCVAILRDMLTAKTLVMEVLRKAGSKLQIQRSIRVPFALIKR